MGNLDLYNAVRSVPDAAKKPIVGGRLKGKTDINPVWRIKTLTEQYGPCGIGWRYIIARQWAEQGAGDEIATFCNIDLHVKHDGEWSEAIPGTGGSMFVEREKSGLHTSDECYKMALTDALSVACKALGVGADVYWEKDSSKYDAPQSMPEAPAKPQDAPRRISKTQAYELIRLAGSETELKKTMAGMGIKTLYDMTPQDYETVKQSCINR